MTPQIEDPIESPAAKARRHGPEHGRTFPAVELPGNVHRAWHEQPEPSRVRAPRRVREVSPRAIIGLVDAARAAGLSRFALEETFGLSEEALRCTTLRFEWNVYHLFLSRLADLARKRNVYETLLEAHAHAYAELRILGTAFTDLQSFYSYFASGVGASLWSNLRLHVESSEGGRRLRVTCGTVRPLDVGADFEALLLTTLRTLPSLVGLPDATVASRSADQCVRFRLTLPEPRIPSPPLSLSSESVGVLLATLQREQATVAEACRTLASTHAVTDPAADVSAQVARAHLRWRITRRQGEVLELLARGHSNREIADTLACAVVTVENHVTALLREVGARSRTALLARVLQA